MRSKVLVAMAAIAVTLGAHGQAIEFKGLALGSSKADLQAKFPGVACRRVPAQFKSLGEEQCSAATISTYAGQPAWDVRFGIVAGRAESFGLTFHARTYETIRDALMQAYGPGSETSVERQTVGGATVSTRVWKSSNWSITVYERGTQVDQGTLMARTPEFDAWLRERAVSGSDRPSTNL